MPRGFEFRSEGFAPSPGQALLSYDYIPAAEAAVPEPTTWAAMTLGFGLVGGAMRRRKLRAAVA